MRSGDRRDDIAAYVIAHGQVRIDTLVEHFGVSRMTIHRHVDQLAERGVLRKLHGAVSAQPSGIYESLFQFRTGLAQKEKLALAEAALAYVEPGQVVMLDDSTTVAALAPRLAAQAPLTVVTNSLGAAQVLKAADGIELLCPGGQYHATYDAYIGHVCETALTRMRADVAVCSASAVDGLDCFIQDAGVVRVKQAMLASARTRILLVDQSKFGRTALHHFARLDMFTHVLVAGGLPPATSRKLTEAGIPFREVGKRST
ncbi:DeoR/GlpR family DNA-binding transcription regulator [Aureimonas frigidaquae]|uniref:DeoR family transcriptional regulator n=1 Tax=Aureimonas frigidaquae TaxID=424757 RepID=A0A0P0Z3C0_9HYPH|nr:DeoR/GlpR family DNA-binding transcription regulator [Aureimonas frigidaquae]BAT28468.1 DeoR family transcriptional regulator [Aureimonas frigidaquae]